MEAKALEGRGIVVTRPAAQAGPLARRLEAAGARVLVFPAIDIEPLADRALPRLAEVDLAVFVSPTAVQCAFERIADWPAGLRFAAVGRGTRRALEARGVRDVIGPEEGADSEALLREAALQELQGRRVLLVRGEGGRELLAETLAARGAAVEHFECYRRVQPHSDPAPLAAAWDRGEIDALISTSVEGLDNLLARFGTERLGRTPLFVTHARIAEHAKQAGIPEVVVAGPGDAELTDALVAYFRPPMKEAPAKSTAARSGRAAVLITLAVLLAAGLGTAGWLDTRGRIDATQEELARRLRAIEADAREARSAAGKTQDAQREVLARLGQLEARLAESQSQQLALEALYQDLSRNRDEWQLAEIEQILAIASHQLQLAGNVRAALLALQLADERLARAERPQFVPVRQALARDIERLKSLPTVDLPATSMRINSLIAQVDSLPLAASAQRSPAAATEQAEPPSAERGFWARLGAEVWSELRQLVIVRHQDARDALLLAPGQEYFLRENLRLRLLGARLALLSRDEAGYREDLRVAQAWIEQHFDARSRHTQEALGELKRLSAVTLSFGMPTIAESLEAVRAFQARRPRAPQ